VQARKSTVCWHGCSTSLITESGTQRGQAVKASPHFRVHPMTADAVSCEKSQTGGEWSLRVYLVHQTDAAVRAVTSRETAARIEQTGPERERGWRGRSGCDPAVGSEREQKAHTRHDGNHLDDGRGNRRRMRGSIGGG
jgi:hypothetical protein